MHITLITSQEDKDFMRDSIFYEFNIESEYIKSKNITEEYEIYYLKDENNLEAVLEIDFLNSKYIITSEGESRETIYIVLD